MKKNKVVATAKAGAPVVARYLNPTKKQYELVAVMEGKTTSAKKKAFLEKMEKQVEAFGGKITETLDWGVRDLAYPILKNTTGVYLILSIELDGKGAKDLHAKLRLDDTLIRSLFIQKEKIVHMKRTFTQKPESTNEES